jgi:predicted methyltransferase MtxX (methanogen marker protein 4)
VPLPATVTAACVGRCIVLVGTLRTVTVPAFSSGVNIVDASSRQPDGRLVVVNVAAVPLVRRANRRHVERDGIGVLV